MPSSDPILLLLSLPLIIITMGLFIFVINALLLMLGFENNSGFPGFRLLERILWRDRHQSCQLDTEFVFPGQRRKDSCHHAPCGDQAGQRTSD